MTVTPAVSSNELVTPLEDSDEDDDGPSGNVSTLPDPPADTLDCTRIDPNLTLLLSLEHFDDAKSEKLLGAIEGHFRHLEGKQLLSACADLLSQLLWLAIPYEAFW